MSLLTYLILTKIPEKAGYYSNTIGKDTESKTISHLAQVVQVVDLNRGPSDFNAHDTGYHQNKCYAVLALNKCLSGLPVVAQLVHGGCRVYT